MAKYDNSFKYKMIEELCNGKSTADVERDYGVRMSTSMIWLRDFIASRAFDEAELSTKDKLKLE